MTRIVTLSLSVLLSSPTLFAQISVGQNEMPHAGDDLFRTKATLNPFLNYTATGPAHNWSFTNLAAADQDEAMYQTVSSTNFVYAIAYADIFFNPNRANAAKQGVDIAFNELLPIQDPYTFFYRSSSTYREVGFGAEVGGIPLPIIFDEQDEVYELPLNYGNTSSSHSAWKINVPTLAYYGYQQQRTNEVDGWGTITTPAGSFDVLRVKTTLEGKDSINVDTLSLGFAIERPVVREYKWLAADLRVPVLQINTTELFGTEVITEVFFYDAPRALAVVPPLGTILCPGSTVTVAYEAAGVYNNGILFVPNNVFRAQLSDANGDFTNAVNIGAVTSTVSGTITATIPANTPLGPGYRIRVIATSPGFTGTDNGVDLTIGAAPVAEAVAGGDLNICEGGSVTLSANAGDDLSYQWLLNGTDLDGATSADLEASAAGNYTVRVSNACGDDESDAIAVAVVEAPEHTLQSDIAFLLCTDSSATITSTNLSGENVTYQWYLEGTPLTGETAASITTTVPGVYGLEALSTLTGCTYIATETLEADPNSSSSPAIIPDGPTTFCEGDMVVLDANAPLEMPRQWYLNGSAILGATEDQLTVSSAGSYAVVVTSLSGCPSQPSVPLVVNVDPMPNQPQITQAGDGLMSTEEGTFQWYLNGVAIPDATASTYTVTVNGDYTVTVTNTFGCSSTSAIFTYISTGIATNAAPNVGVAPNPSTGLFTITWNGAPANSNYVVTDASGRRVAEGRVNGTTTVIDLSGRTSGLYVLRTIGDGRTLRLMLD